MSPPSILLKNGTVLKHDGQDRVHALHNTDVLIADGRIADIGPNIKPPSGSTLELDCQHKIVSPGFVNAHHHLWQTALKGRFADATLIDYMISGNLQSFNFTPEDIFWGQLAGCLEALDAGTTCIIDNAHMSSGPEHGHAALRATAASGIRAIFCYGVTPLRASEWTESSFELDVASALPSWLFPQLDEFARHAPYGDCGQVEIGFFFDSYFLPRSAIVEAFQRVRKMGLKLITSHFRHWPVSKGQASIPEVLEEESLMKRDVLLAHGNGITESQASLLSARGVYVVATPDAEIFMASGAKPVAFREDLPLTCLGADCHSSGPSSMLHQMQMALGSDRAEQTNGAFAMNRYPRAFRAKIAGAFNRATIQGARAAGLGDEIGSIAVGKRADLVLFDTMTPSMVCAVDHDPLVAVVRHAGVKEIDTVIVGGRIRKLDGVLEDVDITPGSTNVKLPVGMDCQAERTMAWQALAARLKTSRAAVQSKIAQVNTSLAREKTFDVLGLSKNGDKLFT